MVLKLAMKFRCARMTGCACRELVASALLFDSSIVTAAVGFEPVNGAWIPHDIVGLLSGDRMVGYWRRLSATRK